MEGSAFTATTTKKEIDMSQVKNFFDVDVTQDKNLLVVYKLTDYDKRRMEEYPNLYIQDFIYGVYDENGFSHFFHNLESAESFVSKKQNGINSQPSSKDFQ